MTSLGGPRDRYPFFYLMEVGVAGEECGFAGEGEGGGESSDFAGGFFEQIVNQGLVGLGLFGGHAAELA